MLFLILCIEFIDVFEIKKYLYMYNFNLYIEINIIFNFYVNVKSKMNLKLEFFLEVFGYKLFVNFCI